MRVGKKRSDRRWQSEDGTVWDSRFEYEVYEHLRAAGVNVRKCGKGDTISYTEPRRSSQCLECGSNEVVQLRTYTSDLLVRQGDGSEYYIEVKGYFPAAKRSLLRHLIKARPDVNIRFVFASNAKAPGSKLRYAEYCAKYFKVPCVVGLNGLEEWT